MCGIVGCVGVDGAGRSLLKGLERLEYRGYDSAGIATGNGGGELTIARATGSVETLADDAPQDGGWGVGHTRWATHGEPSRVNAHPQTGCDGRIAVVHNGIIDNHAELRDRLTERGHAFASETDTEVIAHLLEEAYEGALLKALLRVRDRLQGSYAIAAVHADEPDVVAAARHESPLAVGLADQQAFLASDVTPILDHTDRVVYLQNGDVAQVTPDDVLVLDASGRPRDPDVHTVPWDVEDAEKAGYDHFMLKEIHEQPRVLRTVLGGPLADLGDELTIGSDLSTDRLADADRLVVLAMGTSYHAGRIVEPIIESLAQVPVDVHLACEYRDLDTIGGSGDLAVAVSQSGETADTLQAVRQAKLAGLSVLGITNVVGSTLTRRADGYLPLRAGPEISVAATKTFTSQVAMLAALGLHVGLRRGALSNAEAHRFEQALRALPRQTQRVLDDADRLEAIGCGIADADRALFMGRHVNHGAALEGALKLKEISYIHAEGFAGGELKHGPLALVEEDTPVLAVVGPGPTRTTMLGNVDEVAARGAHVIALAGEEDEAAARVADEVVPIPTADPLLFPVPASVAMQLLAYYAARERGCPIDKPRNLAKSVTVE